MAHDSFRIVAILPAPPARVYAAWLDAEEHAEFTGGDATIDPRVGGKHTAWDLYISGETLELVPGKKIVQSWRTTEFPDDAPDSRLELQLEPLGGGAETRLTLVHTMLPAGQGGTYKDGWGEHYFEPMRAYFEEFGDKPRKAPAPRKAPPAAKAAPVAKAPAKKAVARKAAPVAKKPAGKAAPARKAAPKAKSPGAKRARSA